MLVSSKPAWDKFADVVIVGYGMAGAVAAITAHDEGAKVLILEKQGSEGHYTASSLSGSRFLSPSNIENAVMYLETLYRVNKELTWTDRDTIRAWVEYSCQNKEWMEKMGLKPTLVGKVGEHPDIPGADSMWAYRIPGMGPRMMRLIYDQVRSRGIEVLYSMAAKELVRDLDGEIIGAKADHRPGGVSKELSIGASRAVVLACGGFEYDEGMKLNYLRTYPSHFMGSPANTGDGIRMALDVGADLWHMNCCSASVVLKFSDYPVSFPCELGGQGWYRSLVDISRPWREPAGYLVVDKRGRRFINEDDIALKIHTAYYEFAIVDTERLEYPRIPSYWVFDQSRLHRGPLPILHAGASGPQQLYPWSRDNSREIEKGWIVTAETVTELASKLGLPLDTVERTVMTYNSYCERRADPDFGRNDRGLVPLSKPPFCAVQLWAGGANTQGGPKRNSKAQVLNTRGNPIRRLYAAGELGSIFGMFYPAGGGNLAECIAFGRIAGENSAREIPRSAK